MSVKILQGDCREVLKTLADESVHCCVTSPPYWRLRSYLKADDPNKTREIGSEATPELYVAAMVEVFREVRRVLRKDGTCWINLGDSYASGNHSAASNQHPSRKQKGMPPAVETQTRASINGGGPRIGHGSSFRLDRMPRQDHPHKLAPAIKPKDLVGIPWMVAFALRADGWWLRQDIIWHKKNCMPESVLDRCTKTHEYIFLLTKGPRYYFDADAIMEPCSESTHARLAQDVQNQIGSVRANGGAKTNGNMKAVARKVGTGVGWGRLSEICPTDKRSGRGRIKDNLSMDSALAIMPDKRNKRSVWTVATKGYKEAHFATFPPDLIRPCILAGCPQGGTVLDPFGGSGTVGEVAEAEWRNSILIELNHDYFPLIKQRTAQGGLFARTSEPKKMVTHTL